MRSAQSLIELLIAVGAVSAVLVAIASVATRSLSNQTSAATQIQATELSQAQIELVRGYRDRNGYAALTRLNGLNGNPDCFSVAGCFMYSDYTLSAGSAGVNGPSGLVNVWFQLSTACPGIKIQIAATSKWTDSKGTHSPTIRTCLTDWMR